MRANRLVVLAALAGAYGCAQPVLCPASSCGSPDPRTHRYLVSVLRIPRVEGAGAYGFDLDGRTSTGEGRSCVDLTPDFLSINEPGEWGVDNGLALLVPTLDMLIGGVDAAIAEDVAEGSLLIVVEVSGIDSYVNDASVTVQLHRGAVPDGVELRLEDDGTPSPGQELELDADGPPVAGAIANGRLRAQLAAPWALPIDAGGDIGVITLTLEEVQLRANITQTSLLDGAIGGVMPIEAEDELTRSAIRGDMRPDPMDETRCDGISAGMSFTAVDHVDDFDDAVP